MKDCYRAHRQQVQISAVSGLRPLPHETFLGNRCDQNASPREDTAAAEPARAVAAGAILGVEQPLVRPEGAVEPQGMVEARELDILVEHELAVRDESRVEEREVGRVGKDALMQR